MKKIMLICFITMMLSGIIMGCADNKQAQVKPDEKIQIVTTIFPIYDWVQSIIGEDDENIEVTMLLDDGIDLHSYQPSANDIISVTNCDMFIYVGGESDNWVEDALDKSTNPDLIAVNLMDVLGERVKIEEMVEGMQETSHDHDHEDNDSHEEDHEHADDDSHEEDHEHADDDSHEEDHEHADDNSHEEDHEHADDDHHHEEVENDEHIWLSLKNAQIICQVIGEKLSAIDSTHDYMNKANSYISQLSTLDKQYEEVVTNASYQTLLFGDRFPFRYLADDYNLDYYAAFIGCSAETEASFETITFLSKKMDELDLPAVITIEGATHKIAETVVENTNKKDQSICILDSMQSTTKKDVENGTSYLSIMQNNLSTLEKALN